MNIPRVLWLNGKITINGTDVGTLSAADGPVEVDMGSQQVEASGSRGVNLYIDDVKKEYQITVTGAFFDTGVLQYMEGLAVSFGTLDDGITPSKNFSMDSKVNSIERPYIELLLTGNKQGTVNPSNGNLPYRVEVWAARAKLTGSLNMSMSKSEHSKFKLTFKLLGEQDENAIWFQIRDEEQQS
jgi:hypothetical protein